MNIAILLFDDVDLLDAGGPYEVFLTASRLVERDGGMRPFNLTTVTLDGKPTTAYGGLGLIPHGSVEDAIDADILIVPGTIDIEATMANEQLVSQLSAFANNKKFDNVVASVCTGSFLLAEAGLLVNKKCTTHWEDIDLLNEKLLEKGSTTAGATRDVRWVDVGSVVTGAALSSGIDMSLHLVERFAGIELAQRTAKQLEYRWEKTGINDA